MSTEHGGEHLQGFLPKKFMRLLCPWLFFDDEPPPMEARFLTSFGGALVPLEEALRLSLDSEAFEVSFFLGFSGSSGSSSSTDSYEE